MISIKIPKIHLLKETNLSEDFYHSSIISLLRGFAAVEVAALHLRASFFPGYKSVSDPHIFFQGLAFFTGFGHQAVVLFFLLSGWLVGGSLLNKIAKPNAIKIYAIDRVTRLWIVLIPTFLAIILFAILTKSVNPYEIDYSLANEYSAFSFLGNLVGLQTGLKTTTILIFGGNYPLWSLANETWYYITFPLILSLFTAKHIATKIVSVISLSLIAYFLTYSVILYFSLWLLGVAFSRIKIDATNSFRIILFIIFCILEIFYRMQGSINDLVPEYFVQHFIYSIIFLILLSSMQYKISPYFYLINPVKIIGKFFSEFSFTLYVLHVPIIGIFVYFSKQFFATSRLSQDNPLDFVIYFAMLFAIIVLSYLFYIPFESNTHRVRRYIKNLFLMEGVAAIERKEISTSTISIR